MRCPSDPSFESYHLGALSRDLENCQLRKTSDRVDAGVSALTPEGPWRESQALLPSPLAPGAASATPMPRVHVFAAGGDWLLEAPLCASKPRGSVQFRVDSAKVAACSDFFETLWSLADTHTGAVIPLNSTPLSAESLELFLAAAHGVALPVSPGQAFATLELLRFVASHGDAPEALADRARDAIVALVQARPDLLELIWRQVECLGTDEFLLAAVLPYMDDGRIRSTLPKLEAAHAGAALRSVMTTHPGVDTVPLAQAWVAQNQTAGLSLAQFLAQADLLTRLDWWTQPDCIRQQIEQSGCADVSLQLLFDDIAKVRDCIYTPSHASPFYPTPELAQVREQLARGPVLLWGLPGVGKTALARHIAQIRHEQHRNHITLMIYPHDILVRRVDGNERVSDVVQRLPEENARFCRNLVRLMSQYESCTVIFDEMDGSANRNLVNWQFQERQSELLAALAAVEGAWVIGIAYRQERVEGLSRHFRGSFHVRGDNCAVKARVMHARLANAGISYSDALACATAWNRYLTPSDIVRVATTALEQRLDSIHESTHFVRNASGELVPCGAHTPGAWVGRYWDFMPHAFALPKLTRADLDRASRQIASIVRLD